jgi:hypothetical protein
MESFWMSRSLKSPRLCLYLCEKVPQIQRGLVIRGSYCAVYILLFIEVEMFQPCKKLCLVNCHKYPVTEKV